MCKFYIIDNDITQLNYIVLIYVRLPDGTVLALQILGQCHVVAHGRRVSFHELKQTKKCNE